MGNDLHSIIPQFIVITGQSIDAKVQESITEYCNLDAKQYYYYMHTYISKENIFDKKWQKFQIY